MRNLIIGFFLGALFVGVAWAAQRAVLVDGGGNELGTAGNPLYIQSV